MSIHARATAALVADYPNLLPVQLEYLLSLNDEHLGYALDNLEDSTYTRDMSDGEVRDARKFIYLLLGMN